jgi:bacterioferritin-associated ferredoxin
MIVCHCKGTTDRDIRAAASRGRGSCADLERHCGAGLGAGRGCGGCRPAIRAILAELASSGANAAAARERRD